MSLLRRISRDSYQLSKWSGDAAAYQAGGLPRLAKRVSRRVTTRTLFSIFRNGAHR